MTTIPETKTDIILIGAGGAKKIARTLKKTRSIIQTSFSSNCELIYFIITILPFLLLLPAVI